MDEENSFEMAQHSRVTTWRISTSLCICFILRYVGCFLKQIWDFILVD